MNIVIPMAGSGLRFRDQGYVQPKPLIDVCGKPMLTWALKSLPLHLSNKIIFVCQQELLAHSALEHSIKSLYSRYNPIIVELPGPTDGQAATVLAAADHIDSSASLLIYNIDTYFISNTIEHNLSRTDIDGIISVFKATGTKWSYARTNEDGFVAEVAEKKEISPWATTGLYHFSQGSDFISAATLMIKNNERVNNEFYVAPLYNTLIKQGKKYIIDTAITVFPMGTPADLKETARTLSSQQNS